MRRPLCLALLALPAAPLAAQTPARPDSAMRESPAGRPRGVTILPPDSSRGTPLVLRPDRTCARREGRVHISEPCPDAFFHFALRRARENAAPKGWPDLKARRWGKTDVEVRLSTVLPFGGGWAEGLRRRNGRWSAFSDGPGVACRRLATGGTDSTVVSIQSMGALQACEQAHGRVTAVRFSSVYVPPPDLNARMERAWAAAVADSLLRIPAVEPVPPLQIDGYSGAMEVRAGIAYRATVFGMRDGRVKRLAYRLFGDLGAAAQPDTLAAR